MESLTRLLKRQLKKAFGSPENIPEELNELIVSINQSYIHYESDRALLERTMEISSTELFESNKRLIEEAKKHRKLVAQLKETIMEISSDVKVFEDDDILHVAEILQSEIKKRQIAEQAIATSEEKYRGIIENMELGMLETDSEGKVTKVYEQFSNITGYSAEDLLGKKSMDVLVEKADKPKAILELESRNQKNGNVYELAVNCKDGSTKWMLVSGAPVYGDNGEVTGTVGIHFDITKRKETENELIAAREDAEKLLRIRDQFLANVSHEIRTPMNAVIGMTNLLQDSDINSEQSEYLNAIDVSAKGLLVIINDILDMSKINSGKFSIESIDFNLDHVLKNLMAGLQIKAEEKGIYLQCSRDPRISRFLKGDPTRLNQVLINLCSNAIKFTDTGGVTIEIKYLGTSNSKDKIEFRIIDTGKGIAPEKLNTIFDSFSQEDDTITRNYGGTGLGLTISKQIIGFFESDLKVQSTLGMGSEFHFTLELPHGGQVMKSESVSANKDLSNTKILLVEDNVINQLLATKLLGKWKAEVFVANNGFEALDWLEKDGFDVVLMDMQMPGMGGVECTQIIRGDRKLELPIIALTANAVKGEKDKCIDAGMNDYVSKPFDPDELYSKICQLVAGLGKLKEARTFNIDKIDRLYNGNAVKINDLLKMINAQIKDDLVILKDKAKEKDQASVSFLVHKMKSTLDLIGNDELRHKIGLLEGSGEDS